MEGGGKEQPKTTRAGRIVCRSRRLSGIPLSDLEKSPTRDSQGRAETRPENKKKKLTKPASKPTKKRTHQAVGQDEAPLADRKRLKS